MVGKVNNIDKTDNIEKLIKEGSGTIQCLIEFELFLLIDINKPSAPNHPKHPPKG